jgi:hypothetical protein
VIDDFVIVTLPESRYIPPASCTRTRGTVAKLAHGLALTFVLSYSTRRTFLAFVNAECTRLLAAPLVKCESFIRMVPRPRFGPGEAPAPRIASATVGSRYLRLLGRNTRSAQTREMCSACLSITPAPVVCNVPLEFVNLVYS